MICWFLLLTACQGPTLPPRVVEEADPLHIIEPITAPAGAELEVAVTVSADEATAALPGEPLAIDVFGPRDLSPAGFPMLHRRPLSRHVHASPAEWPVVDTVTVAAVAGAQLVAWLDVDRSGDLSPGDRVGEAVPLAAAEEVGEGLRLALEVGRILTTVGASPPRAEVKATVRQLRVARQGRLMVLGYPADAVGSGRPQGRPLVRWSSPGVIRDVEESHALRLPVEPALWLMAGVDTDQDGALEFGDPISRPVEGWSGGAVDFELSVILER